MQKFDRGFTLIELVILVAIIGILASIAVSAYQTYTVRGQVAEALNMAAGAKAPVIDAYKLSGSPPADRAAAGMTGLPSDTQGKYVSKVDVINARVQVTFGNDAHQDIQNLNISLTPYIASDGSIVWRCGEADAPAGTALLAGGGVTTAHQAPTIETRYLPSSCRK